MQIKECCNLIVKFIRFAIIVFCLNYNMILHRLFSTITIWKLYILPRLNIADKFANIHLTTLTKLKHKCNCSKRKLLSKL